MILAGALVLVAVLFFWIAAQQRAFDRHDSFPSGAIGYRLRDHISADDAHAYMWTMIAAWTCVGAAAMRLFDLYG